MGVMTTDIDTRSAAWCAGYDAGMAEARARLAPPALALPPTIVGVPGEFHAVYDDGVITSMVFMPLGSHAGYFGPAAEVIEGDKGLDVEETDGPFWRAMQAALAADQPIKWEE